MYVVGTLKKSFFIFSKVFLVYGKTTEKLSENGKMRHKRDFH